MGSGDWLIIEADESDGSVVQYHPEIGLLLNIDKDHQEIAELIQLFTTFRKNTKGLFITNKSNSLARELSMNDSQDFGFNDKKAGFNAENFSQQGFKLSFNIKNQSFEMNAIGQHSVENATAAVAVAHQIGVDLSTCAESLSKYEGIYRRHQILGEKNGVWVIDDYGHNPAKCSASIRACQLVGSGRVVAWFQPHGYGPTRFLKDDFIEEFSKILRSQDELLMSEIFYAGGTAVRDISANDLVKGIQEKGKIAHFIENRNDLLLYLKQHLKKGDILLLMGARDPSLEEFCKFIFNNL